MEMLCHDLSQFPEYLRGRRILLCTESFGPVNGVSRTTLMLVNHLRANGAQVAVVAPRNHACQNTFTPANHTTQSGAPLSNCQLEIRVDGYPVPFNPELSIVYPVRNSTLFARTWGIDRPPDLIYLASPASLGFQVMLQLRQQPASRQIPIICNFQTYLSGYCYSLFPWPLSRLAAYTFDSVQSYLFFHPSVHTIFYPSRFVRRYLEAQNVPASKMALLGRGVNTELFHPSKRSDALRADILSQTATTSPYPSPFLLNPTRMSLTPATASIPTLTPPASTLTPPPTPPLLATDNVTDGEPALSDQLILVTVSRLAGEKGFDFLARVARELYARGLPFTLYIVGGNRNGEVEREVRTLFDAPLRARGVVQFAGFQVGDALATAYASADLFLHCSITETFGLVVLESLASGVPVIARDQGGPSDTLVHGETGFLVPPDDLDLFVAAVLRFAADPALRTRMAARARDAACAATWTRINNMVAWRMADTIAERERALRVSAPGHATPERQPLLPPQSSPPSAPASSAQQQQQQQQQHMVPLYGWLMLSEALRETLTARLMDVSLVGGLGLVVAFWTLTRLYMACSQGAVWARTRAKAVVGWATVPANVAVGFS